MPPFSHKENLISIYDPEYIKGLFHTMSLSYDRMNYVASFGFSSRWRYQFLKKITMQRPDLRILDLMTGMGEMWAPIKGTFPDSNLTALDFCEGMIDKARKKNAKKHNNAITVVHQDALKSEFAPGSFDAIVCCFGLKTFSELQMVQLAREVKRLLKPGGQFSFIEISVPSHIVLRSFYKLYLKYIIPFIGRVMLGNPREYRMLWEYTSRFINSDRTTSIFSNEGLETKNERYFFGCASGISGYKHA